MRPLVFRDQRKVESSHSDRVSVAHWERERAAALWRVIEGRTIFQVDELDSSLSPGRGSPLTLDSSPALSAGSVESVEIESYALCQK